MASDDGTATVDWLATGRQVMRQQPFSMLLGTKIEKLDTLGSRLELPIAPDHGQHLGFVHGGVIAYMADNAIAFAAGPYFGAQVVTSDFSINFVRPAKGENLIAEATVVSSGKTKLAINCHVYSVEAGKRRLCAIAMGTVLRAGGAPT